MKLFSFFMMTLCVIASSMSLINHFDKSTDQSVLLVILCHVVTIVTIGTISSNVVED